MNTRRAEANFTHWKRLVGLAEKFPTLEPLDPAELDKTFLRSHRHLEAFLSVSLRMGNPRLAVIVERGQGCTTIYRHALYEAQQSCLTRRLIPIEVPLAGGFWEGDAKQPLDLDYTIRFGVFASLVTNSWDRVLSRQDYNTLVNAWERESELAQHLIVLQRKVTTAIACNERLDWSTLAAENNAPDFSQPLEAILATLFKLGLHPILMFDTSWDQTSKSEALRAKRTRALASALKSLYNQNLFADNRLSHVLFVDRETLELIREVAALSFEYDEIVFEGYSPNEIFGMLNKHYSWVMDLSTLPKLGPIRIDRLPLAAILDEEFSVHAFDGNKGINQIITDMRAAMLESLDVPWDKVPYRLHP